MRIRCLYAVAAVAAAALAFAPAGLSAAVLNASADTWVRESAPDTVYANDAMSVWSSLSSDGARRYGIVEFDVSAFAGQPITSAGLNLWSGLGASQAAHPIKQTAFVIPSVTATATDALTWNLYQAERANGAVSLQTLGAYNLAATNDDPLIQDAYVPSYATMSDLALIQAAANSASGKLTMVMIAAEDDDYRQDWGDTFYPPNSQLAQLYINQLPPELANIDLEVNRFSGGVRIVSRTSFTNIDVDGYTIESAAGSLVPAAWTSLTDSGAPGWQENAPSATGLSETNLMGSSSLPAAGAFNLGNVFASNGVADVQFNYSLPSGIAIAGDVVYVGGLELRVTTLLGAGGAVTGTRVQLLNPESVGIDIDGYVIQSASGALNPAALNGLTEQLGGTWGEIALSATAITELNLLGSSVLGDDSSLNLGAIFTAGGAEDLLFTFNLAATGEQLEGLVTYLTQLLGDANGDNTIDIFDVATISNQWGTSGPEGDVNGDGTVDIFDVAVVSNNWGNTLPNNASAVPEPATWSLAAIGLALGLIAARRKT